MIEKQLADFIVNEGVEALYFLKLVSQCVLQDTSEITLNLESCDMDSLLTYETSDLLELLIQENKVKVILKKDGNWIFNILHKREVSSEEDNTYICKDLQYLSELLPKDVDWALNPGKYVKNFNRIFKKFGKNRILEISKLASDKGNINLNMFLTEKVFNSLSEEFDFKRSKKVEDRVEIADYSEEQPY